MSVCIILERSFATQILWCVTYTNNYGTLFPYPKDKSGELVLRFCFKAFDTYFSADVFFIYIKSTT